MIGEPDDAAVMYSNYLWDKTSQLQLLKIEDVQSKVKH